MSFHRPIVVLVFLCACDAFAPAERDAGVASGGHAEPLPPDLVAACPKAQSFERSGERACTEIGCLNGFNLNLSPSSGWSMGAYTFEVTVDGRAVTCQGSIPLAPCGEPSFSCDADGVRLGESGCALAPNQQGIANIALESFPLALSVRVLKDGSELSSTQLKPTYTASQPNGPGCDPICCSSAAELNIFATR